jgi:Protein of unknown function (DUF3108)
MASPRVIEQKTRDFRPLPCGLARGGPYIRRNPGARLWVRSSGNSPIVTTPSHLIRICGLAGLLGAALTLATTGADAQGRLEAKYEVTLAGLPIGKGAWVIEVADDQFSAAASGGSAGLLSMVSSGQGSGASQGRVIKGQLQPAAYTATIATNRKSETIRIALAGGNIKDFSIDPTPPEDPNKIPVTDAHKRGVIDPMTASLVNVGGTGDPVSADACAASSAVFDGRMRYDLSLEFKRIEAVKVDGYQGLAAVCAIYFSPIAGHDPNRAAIKYLIAQRHMEIWLAPIAGTRVLVPLKLTIPTPFGTGKLEATRFVSTPMLAHGTTIAPKTQ